MTTAEVTPTSIALAVIGGHEATLVDLLVKIPTDEASVQDVFKGKSAMAADLMRALKGADTDCVNTKVADIITGALAGVTLSANGAAYTAPWLHHVAHFSKFIKQSDFDYSVNALISRMFEGARLGAGYVKIPPNSLGDVQFTDILASAMAEIFFAHIVRQLGADSMSLLPLSLVQFINKVTVDPENSDRILRQN
jgi:hypothetical protein